ncbi:MAG: LexA family protein [Christensenellales bacterium]|jgi:repressor LexA
MNRIRELRIYNGLSQDALAKILNVHQTAVSQWEKGRTTPDIEVLPKIAQHFNVSVDYLLGIETSNSTHLNKGVKIPVLGHIAAGIPIDAIEDILNYEEISAEWTKGGSEFFGFKVKGSSMEPRIQEGDVVIVRKQPDVESGDIAAVIINGENATVKKVIKHDDALFLVSINPAYTPMYYTAKEIKSLPVQILGKVVELRGKF